MCDFDRGSTGTDGVVHFCGSRVRHYGGGLARVSQERGVGVASGVGPAVLVGVQDSSPRGVD